MIAPSNSSQPASKLRSLLFVPGDRPDRLEKALSFGADALIIDLEDSVTLPQKATARVVTADFLRSAHRTAKLFVRVNPVGSPQIEDDLEAILSGLPDGLVIPKAEGAQSVEALAAKIGNIPVLPVATETPSAVFQLGSYARVAGNLMGLTWGAEDLPAAIGAITAREESGNYTSPYELVRSLTLFGAHAADVPAIETVYPNFRDLEGLAAYARRGYRDGFTGMMAIHPSQVSVINKAFTPTPAQVKHARAIVEAFAANPGVGAIQMDGKMIDAPHLKQAHRLLAAADPVH